MLSSAARARRPVVIEVDDIVDLSHEARGVAHRQGKAVFIDDALPGERVEWSLQRRGKRFDEGKLQRVLTASPDRTPPRCAHHGVCGGCALQHLSAQRQIEFKQHQLSDALSRIGRVTPRELLPPLRANEWNYRRRARLTARWVPKKNRVLVGFRERATHYVADLQRCEVLSTPVAGLIVPLSELLTSLSVRDRIPQIEVAVAERAVALVMRVLAPLTAADLSLLRAFAVQRGVHIYLQSAGYDSITPLDESAPELTYSLPQFAVELAFQPTDFVQINAELNQRMVSQAVDLLQIQPGDQVLDLFCGLGNFSLPLARRAARVVGVDGDAGLVARARHNATRNGIANAEFFSADLMAEKCSHDVWADVWADAWADVWAARDYAKILLDPPRAGASAILPWIGKSTARRVAYVSCHPGSLARDAGILVHDHGFDLCAAGVMDMFPHTTHVESIAVFERS